MFAPAHGIEHVNEVIRGTASGEDHQAPVGCRGGRHWDDGTRIEVERCGLGY